MENIGKEKTLKFDSYNLRIIKKVSQTNILKVFEVEDISKNYPNKMILKEYTVFKNNISMKAFCDNIIEINKKICHKNFIRPKYNTITSMNDSYLYNFLYDISGSIKLSEILNKTSNLNEFHIWRIIYEISLALNNLHLYKYVFRKVNSDNIYLFDDGSVKLGFLDNCAIIDYYKNLIKIDSFNGSNEITHTTNGNNISYDTFFLNQNIKSYNQDLLAVINYLNLTMKIEDNRTPEEMNLSKDLDKSEKSDIYSLGILMIKIIFEKENISNSGLIDQRQLALELIEKSKNLNYSLTLIETLRSMIIKNTNERISAFEILNFIETNLCKGNSSFFKSNDNINFHYLDLNKSLQSLKSYSNLLHTLFGINYLTNFSVEYIFSSIVVSKNSTILKLDLLKNIVIYFWKLSDNKVKSDEFNKIVIFISYLPNLFSWKILMQSLINLNHFIFLSPNFFTIYNKSIDDKDNIVTYLDFLVTIWNYNLYKKFYEEDSINTRQVIEFLIKLSDLTKNKIKLFIKYPFLECNYTFDFESDYFTKMENYNNLLEKGFINDLLVLLSQLFQTFNQVPFENEFNYIIEDTDIILQILNQEIVTLIKVLYILIFAFKNINSNDVNMMNIFDKRYIELIEKIKLLIEKYKKKRLDLQSKFILYEIQDFYTENLNHLTERLKNFPNYNFITKLFLEDSKSLCGTQIHRNIRKMIQNDTFKNYDYNYVNSYNKNQNVYYNNQNSNQNQNMNNIYNQNLKNSNLKNNIQVYNNELSNYNSTYNQNQDNYINDNIMNVKNDDKLNKDKENIFENLNNIIENINYSSKTNLNFDSLTSELSNIFNYQNVKKEKGDNENLFSKFNNSKYLENNNGLVTHNYNPQNNRKLLNQSLSSKNSESKKISHFFSSNNKNTDLNNFSTNIKNALNFNNPINLTVDEDIDEKSYDTFQILNKSLFQNINQQNSGLDNNNENKINGIDDYNSSFYNPINFSNSQNKFDGYNTNQNFNNQNSNYYHHSKSFVINNEKNLDPNELKDLQNNTLTNNNLNQFKNNYQMNSVKKSHSLKEQNIDFFYLQNEGYYQNTNINQNKTNKNDILDNNNNNLKNLNNLNIPNELKYNYMPVNIIGQLNNNNINNISYYDNNRLSVNKQLTDISDFLQKEVSRLPNYIINSKEITIGKQIGFGGSSEVYLGSFRGSDVAVKKLRIGDLKEEKLKEFKREVSSLSMMRHPLLVLFMGAM